MQCNIDAKGKAVRLTFGALMLIVGLFLLALLVADEMRGRLAWIAATALTAFGLFGIFEAAAGWCVVRAMGFRTRL